jgi:hypothetical protein
MRRGRTCCRRSNPRSLLVVSSFARPAKLFTAHAALMVRSVGVLNSAALARVLTAVLAILQPPTGPCCRAVQSFAERKSTIGGRCPRVAFRSAKV